MRWRYTVMIVLVVMGAGVRAPATEPPSNDAAADAITLDVPGRVIGTTEGATVDDGEPSCGLITGASVWYRFAAPALSEYIAGEGAPMVIDLDAWWYGSLAVYAEAEDGSLIPQVCPTSRTPRTGFRGEPGATYYVQIGSAEGSYDQGAFTLTLGIGRMARGSLLVPIWYDAYAFDDGERVRAGARVCLPGLVGYRLICVGNG